MTPESIDRALSDLRDRILAKAPSDPDPRATAANAGGVEIARVVLLGLAKREAAE